MGKQASKMKPKNLAELAELTSFMEEDLLKWYKSFVHSYPNRALSVEDLKKVIEIYPALLVHTFAGRNILIFTCILSIFLYLLFNISRVILKVSVLGGVITGYFMGWSKIFYLSSKPSK